MSLPIYQTKDQTLSLLQTQWASQLNPLLSAPIASGILLKSVSLTSGANVVNHLLGRPLQGWILVRVRASATFYDTQDLNPTPALTLQLQASANVTVDIFVF